MGVRMAMGDGRGAGLCGLRTHRYRQVREARACSGQIRATCRRLRAAHDNHLARLRPRSLHPHEGTRLARRFPNVQTLTLVVQTNVDGTPGRTPPVRCGQTEAPPLTHQLRATPGRGLSRHNVATRNGGCIGYVCLCVWGPYASA